MKPWDVVGLLNKSGLTSSMKTKYLKKATKRLNLKLSKDHLFALKLSTRDTIQYATRNNIPITLYDFPAKKLKDSDIAIISTVTPVTVDDILMIREYHHDRSALMQHLGLTLSLQEASNIARPPVYFLSCYKYVLDTRPSLAQLKEIATNTMCSENGFVNLCQDFGIRPGLEDLIDVMGVFSQLSTVYSTAVSRNLDICPFTLIENKFPGRCIARHMISTACPIIYSTIIYKAGSIYPDPTVLNAKRSIKVIQRFFRFVIRKRATVTIQRNWRRAISNPNFELARKTTDSRIPSNVKKCAGFITLSI